MKSIFGIFALAAVALAGLEDAKYSSALDADSFAPAIARPTVGTLVAFFAPWCGHCKSLESTWTAVAKSFENDDRCRIAHVDADNAKNKPLAQTYGVQGFPTLVFIPSHGSAPTIPYNQGRSEEAILDFMNTQCGTNKLPGGRLDPMAGRIGSLDEIARTFFSGHKDEDVSAIEKFKQDAVAKLSDLVESLGDAAGLGSFYVKVAQKWVGKPSKEGLQWLGKEVERLGRVLSGGKVAGSKRDELEQRQNILRVFLESVTSDAGVAAHEEL